MPNPSPATAGREVKENPSLRTSKQLKGVFPISKWAAIAAAHLEIRRSHATTVVTTSEILRDLNRFVTRIGKWDSIIAK